VTVRADERFADFYRREHARVLATTIVATGDVDVAAEATDEAFARALERWARVGELSSPGGWTTTTALNAARRLLRRRSLERRLLRRHAPDRTEAPPALPTDLWEAVRTLPPRMRTAIALRYVADLPEAAVADAMGIAVGTVSSTLHAARQRLSDTISQEA
jgi:RNA polymerase sigma factor (sigma-70 family)